MRLALLYHGPSGSRYGVAALLLSIGGFSALGAGGPQVHVRLPIDNPTSSRSWIPWAREPGGCNSRTRASLTRPFHPSQSAQLLLTLRILAPCCTTSHIPTYRRAQREAPHDLGQVSTMQREGETRAVWSTMRMVSRHRHVSAWTLPHLQRQRKGEGVDGALRQPGRLRRLLRIPQNRRRA